MKMSRTAKVLIMRDGEWPESRFRDKNGREHYDNGRYAPTRSEYIPRPEASTSLPIVMIAVK